MPPFDIEGPRFAEQQVKDQQERRDFPTITAIGCSTASSAKKNEAKDTQTASNIQYRMIPSRK